MSIHTSITHDYLPLERVGLFTGLSSQQYRRLARRTSLVQIAAGRELIHQGKVGGEFIILAAGEAVLTRSEPGAAPFTLELHPGDFAGELALLDHTPRNATLTAVTDSAIYVCSPSEFRDIMNLFPTVAARIEAAARERRSVAVVV